MKTQLFLLLIASIAMTACKKKHTGHFSGSIATISPNNGDTIQGNSVIFSATGTANRELHGWFLGVYDASNLNPLFETEEHVHGESLSIQQTVPFTLTDTTTLTIKYEIATENFDEHIEKEITCTWIP
jgi:uncharacterized protein YbbC (DUF1343 family)